MILNSDAKFKEKLTCSFKHDMRNLINFHPIKSLKISPRRALFVQSIKAWDKKNKEELSLMTLKGGAKCKWKLTCGLKNDKEFCYFSCEQLKVWKFALDGFLLSKGYKVLHDKVQKSYFSWHWRVMQSLKKNWLLVSKMTWQIW